MAAYSLAGDVMTMITVAVIIAAVSLAFLAAAWLLIPHGQHTAPHGHADDDPNPEPREHTGPFPELARPPGEPGDTGWLPATLPALPPRPGPHTQPHAVPDVFPGTHTSGCGICGDPGHAAAGHAAVFSIIDPPAARQNGTSGPAPWMVEANNGHPDADSSLRSIVMRAIPDDDPEDGDG